MAPREKTIDGTSNHDLSTTSVGSFLVQTKAPKATASPGVSSEHTSSISEPYIGVSTRSNDTRYYITQVHNALESLISMLAPNRTAHRDITTADVTRVNNSSTALGSRPSTIDSASPASVSVDPPTQNESRVHLIFVNFTSPCYVALDRSNASFIMLLQAPISERLTPADVKALNDAKRAETWTAITYYWTKVVCFTVGGVYALITATLTIINIVTELRAWLVRRRAL